MGSTQDYVDFVQERIGLGARITNRKMFGEYALHLDGKVLVLICDNSVYLKPLPANDALAKGLPQGSPYPGAKAHWVLDELLEDTDRLQEILQVTADALPAPKPKTKKAAKTSKAASATSAKPAKKAAKKVAKKATTAAPKPRKT
ncbi:MAG TPA: TfoX/Sxy family protein [Gemmatimonas sp.]|uniref:TfoX/Sxy family protein n=1 Tax=Gemmatimonas sp. TaxID=1962908 RepID=UPI002EDB52BA